MFVINDQVASLIIFGLGFIIIAFSVLSLYLIYINTVLHNAFGYICAAQSIAEAIVAACFAFWAAPVSYFNPAVSSTHAGYWIGHIVIYFYFLAVWLHFCKSMNRCFAIIFPIKYHVNFTIDIAKRLILGVMTLALLSAGISFLYPCNPYFNTTEHSWGSRDEQCWERINKYADRSVSAITAGGSLVFDVITWIYLLSINKRFKQHSATNSVNEKRFFFQTCLGTILHMITLSCSTIFLCMTDDLSMKFLLNTVAWLLFHLTNQLLFIIYSVTAKSLKKRISIFSLSSKVKAHNPAVK